MNYILGIFDEHILKTCHWQQCSAVVRLLGSTSHLQSYWLRATAYVLLEQVLQYMIFNVIKYLKSCSGNKCTSVSKVINKAWFDWFTKNYCRVGVNWLAVWMISGSDIERFYNNQNCFYFQEFVLKKKINLNVQSLFSLAQYPAHSPIHAYIYTVYIYIWSERERQTQKERAILLVFLFL